MLQIHYIRALCARSILFLGIWLVLVALVACSDGDSPPDDVEPSSSSGDNSGGPCIGSNSPDIENAIKIEYKNGSAPEIINAFSEVAITSDGENVVVALPDSPPESEIEYDFVLSGTTSNGSLKLHGNVRKALNLNGVCITNSAGPAINIQGGKKVIVNLLNGTKSSLTDGSGYKCSGFAESEEQAKGAFFSEGKLEFVGSGSLGVKGKCNHAIVADNSLEIKGGTITVSESLNDGIHANDRIEVSGGNITIRSIGDAIQSEKSPKDYSKDWLVFSGGKIDIQTTGTKSHGIASEGPVTIKDDADITINVSGNGSKGIRARSWVEFYGGKTSIKTTGTKTDTGDPQEDSNSAGMKLTDELFFHEGELTIKTTGNGAKGINVDGNATIEGGKINIDANDDGLKVHGTLKIEGGTGTIKSTKKSAIDADNWNGDKGSIITQSGGS